MYLILLITNSLGDIFKL